MFSGSNSRARRHVGLHRALCLALMLLAAGRAQPATILGQTEPPPDLADFKTPDTAQTMRLGGLARASMERLGFLGIETDTNADGTVIVTAIAPDSPASRAGFRTNDLVARFDGERVASPDALRQSIESHAPGASVQVSVLRGGQTLDLTARLASLGGVGRPLDRIRLGVQTGDLLPRGGFPVEEVEADSTGARAGLKVNDVILKINDTRLDDARSLSAALADAPANEIVMLTLARDGGEFRVQTRLVPADAPDRPAGYFGRRGGFGLRGFNNRANPGALRVAIVGIEFPDVRHNPRITAADWEREFFSTNTYTGRNATGQSAHGSVNDYYLEQSVGTLRVEGRMFDWIQVSKKRLDYSPTAPDAATGRGDDGTLIGGNQWADQDAPLVNEVLDRLVEREGRDALNGYDAVVFLYAGDPATRNDASVYWPHTTAMLFQYRRLRYVVSFEGGERMSDISILCHELGHVMGLPDLYVRRAPNPVPSTTPANTDSGRGANSFTRRNPNPYIETLANWDLMSVQVGYGRPQHLSAWSKEQLGWIKPVVIDPMVRQKLVLAPIENSTNQCFKIPLRPDASEYLLLENRRKIGFDQSVPAEGLLIWRVVYGRPVLEEAHGFTGANAARVDIRRIPYPTYENNSFTPFSRPSSAAYTGDELPVYLTDIRRLPGGRISFRVGNGYD